MRTRTGHVIAVALLVTLSACSSSSKHSSNSNNNGGSGTTASPASRDFHVDTPAGQVSLSLDGHLPPNWPSSFPVPDGATPAGSGSLAGSSKGFMIGVFKTSEAPADVFNFYKTNTAYTVGNSSSAGAGGAYAGNVSISGTYNGNVSIVASGGTTYIIVSLTGAATGTTTTT